MENPTYRVAAALAPLLGAALETPQSGESWRAWLVMPCGLRIIVSKTYGKKGEIRAHLPRPGYPGESVSCGSIGADIARAPDALARDIQRRLIPSAQEKASAARVKWAAQESAKDSLAGMAALFSGVPGVRVKVEKAGTADQRLEIHYYESEKGSLTANVYPSGNVYVDRVSLYSGATSESVLALIRAIAA